MDVTVEVKITRSNADGSPSFTVEGNERSLNVGGDFWTGSWQMSIHWPLEVVFESGAYSGQTFEMTVVAKHPYQASKDKKDTFRGRESGGRVRIEGLLA